MLSVVQFKLLLLMVAIVLIPCAKVAGSAEKIVKEENTGCRVKINWDAINSIRWTGKCIDGWIDGPGVIEYYVNDRKEWEQALGGTNGIKVVAGDMQWNFGPEDLEFRLANCDKKFSYRAVHVKLKRPLDIEGGWVADRVLELAADYAKQKCPKRDYRNIKVVVELPGFSKLLPALEARNYDENRLTWAEYNNIPQRKLASKIRDENLARKQKAREAAEHERQLAVAGKKDQIARAWKQHMKDIFDSGKPTDAIADMIVFDKTRFILEFSEGRKILMVYENPAFANGQIVVRWQSAQTNIYKDMEKEFGADFSWDKWFKQFGENENAVFLIACMMPPSYAQDLSQNGIHEVDAKLVSLQGSQVVFNCGN